MKKLIALFLALSFSSAQAQFVQGPQFGAGQIPGTITNDNAAAGKVGEYVLATTASGSAAQNQATVTISQAAPGIVTWSTTSPYITSNATITATCAVINFTTTGALPAPLAITTNYYVGGSSISGDTFSVATTCANAIAGTYITTTNAGSGTHTGFPTGILATSNTALDIAGFALTAGDWEITGQMLFFSAATTSITQVGASISTTSNTALSNPEALNNRAFAASVPGVANNSVTAGPRRLSLSATTNVFCSARATFTVDVLSGWGGCRARRLR